VQHHVDDVAFTRALLDDLATKVKFDPKRVYATGMSNGAIMAYRLASELSDRIAAIAPVSGPMGTVTCNPRRPVSVMHFHGTADEFAPFAGGTGKKSLSGIKFYSVEHTIQAWVKADGCRKEPLTEALADTKDGTKIKIKKYLDGREGAEVVLVVIEGGGHAWPGKEPRVNFLDKSTKSVSANDLMWDFFERHPVK
jgi:polyhydroxybutyrate depolymerase